MRLHRLISYLSTQCWAMEPRTLALGQQMLREALAGRSFTGADLHAQLDIDDASEAEPQQVGDRVGIRVIPIMGVIEERASSLGTSTQAIERDVRDALADKETDALLFDVDSPGGVVSGVPELAGFLQSVQDQKPMLALSAGMMASAAYWIGAAAGEVWSTPSSQTGSIGVFTLHQDLSKQLEQDGITVTEITEGTFKTETAPWKPLSEEAEADLRRNVKQAMDWFVKSVAADRGTTPRAVRAGFGEGRTLFGQDAKAAGLVDRIGGFDEAVQRLTDRVVKPRRGRRASAQARELALRSLGPQGL